MYLPQYHPVPENDKFWGKGFTEWVNVASAKPLYRWQIQPRIPKDLGFYDLRLQSVRQDQAKLAEDAGVHGFCYYHYWSLGKRILELPFNEVLRTKTPDFPFMLCWANHDWTMRWAGKDDTVLFKQEYSDEDYLNHIKWLIPVFKDTRYIKVNGKPVLMIYRSDEIPDFEKMVSIWRKEAALAGLELYLIRFERPKSYGEKYLNHFDAAAEIAIWSNRYKLWPKVHKFDRLMSIDFFNALYALLFRKDNYLISHFGNRIIEYKYFIDSLADFRNFYKYKIYPGIFPNWDTTPRYKKKNCVIIKDSTPDLFKKWINKTIEQFEPYSDDENFIFINAWNEWGEGSYLEPDQLFGNSYLLALKEAISKV
ncbi:MAG: glycoside hydrolase family 99-like domain-containing protein [Saprospiraceae bacterium]|nr:glycoside hydrolase family 99-like domain-containing protein [Saprospiraceae bacterium]